MTTTSTSETAHEGRKFLIALLLPLFFVIAFSLAFASAFHAPKPNGMSLHVEGANQVVSKITANLDDSDKFSAEHSDVPGSAKDSVEERTADGAIRIATADRGSADNPKSTKPGSGGSKTDPQFTVTTYVASGGGKSVAAAVRTVGDQVAKQLGTTAKVVDVAPLTDGDAQGIGLFYLLVYTSLGAYLVIITLTQVAPRTRLRSQYLAASAISIAAPLIVFGLSSIFIGDYSVSSANILAVLAVNALYVFTVASIAILLQQILRSSVTFGVMAIIIFLNFPSAGGAVPASMLPDFWQGVHSFYFGSAANEAFRSLVYFDGNGVGRWLLQLGIWTVVIVLTTLVLHFASELRRFNRSRSPIPTSSVVSDPSGTGAGTDSALAKVTHTSQEAEPQRSRRPVTAGSEAAR